MKVFLIIAQTIDGFIARDSTHLSTTWTSKADRVHFTRLTKEAGVVVCGSTTFATFNRALPGRRTIVYTRNPAAITAEGVETTIEPPADLIARLQQEGAKAVAICGGASIYDLFLHAGVVTDIYLTIEPVIFGQGITSFTHLIESRMELVSIQPAKNGNTLFLHYAAQQ